jgi:hypothetical protein
VSGTDDTRTHSGTQRPERVRPERERDSMYLSHARRALIPLLLLLFYTVTRVETFETTNVIDPRCPFEDGRLGGNSLDLVLSSLVYPPPAQHGRAATCTSKHQLMTGSAAVRVTTLTSGSERNPSRACGHITPIEVSGYYYRYGPYACN